MNNSIDFPYALKSFLGFLQGTRKSAHTLVSYKGDLRTFQDFLEKDCGKKPKRLDAILRKDLVRYSDLLKERGQKANTRRRKVLTVRRFLRYLVGRGHLAQDASHTLAPPDRVERVPFTIPWRKAIEFTKSLPIEHLHEARDRLILWTLLETGMNVEELVALSWESSEKGMLKISGKRARALKMSKEWSEAWEAMHEMYLVKYPKRPPITPFCGFNRYGPLSARMSTRAVELVVKSYRSRFGEKTLTPRILRNAVIANWANTKITQDEIKKRLGWRTHYSFRRIPQTWKKG